MTSRSWVRVWLLLGVAALVPACGGGGGGGVPAADAIQFLSAVFAAAEGDGTVTITVRRTGSTGPASVNYATANGTATAGSDYTATSGTLSWAAGEAGDKTFTIDVAAQEGGAGTTEGTETIKLSLSLSRGAPLGALVDALVLLRDLDGPAEGVLQFSAATYTVSEGNATVPVTITVERNGGALGTVTVDVTVANGASDPATSGADYNYTGTALNTGPVSLSFAAGETSKTFTIDVLSDGADGDGIENVDLTLTNVVSAEIGTAQPTATLQIVDNDQAGTVQLASANFQNFENGVSVVVTVTRSGGSAVASVDLQVSDGTATAGSDYTAPSPATVPLSWAEGDITPRTLVILLTDDSDLEGNETIDLDLVNVGGATLGAPATGTVTIVDDEPGTVDFLAADFAVNEGNAGTSTVTITVVRSGGSAGAATVEVDVNDGTATDADNDFEFPTPNPFVLNWSNGQSGPKTFDITINGDATVELDETIGLVLQNAVGTGLGTLVNATATITNDDASLAGQIEFLSAAVNVLEDAGTVTLTVRRVNGTAGAVSVDWATSNGSAVSNGKPSRRDYVAGSNTLTWADGDGANKSIIVTIINNDAADSQDATNETFNVTLTPVGGATINPPATAVVTIQEN